ncbi:TIGR03618 family F420-dependent PPOX class oxidoreductase [Nakamurella endophytica]|uniref:PPOX class F420-dependent enzyme n=1 Tax=Nakamurella endophytica TaxID=1748367 RepID=A0A917SY73_9ACTN|nr:TIGR03618 family F420-dependent PPOX class oxidoreductase [Nakamurella endophytica]GGM02675.1 PPOX class F420-dependent enzyme [Nakamurella endophytica]
MTRPPLSDAALELLGRPQPAVMATLKPDGQPVTVATWYLLQGQQILVNLADVRRRLDWLRQDGRVALTVLGDNWYTHVSIQGQVAAIADDPDLTDIDRIASHYTGKPYADRQGRRVSALIDVTDWHAWNL